MLVKKWKHKFVKVWSKAESSRKSFGNFEAKDRRLWRQKLHKVAQFEFRQGQK